MMVAIDTESYGFSNRFKASIIYSEDFEFVFTNKHDMWAKLISMGISESKHNRVLNMYAHNHEFDYIRYADLEDQDVIKIRYKPFLAKYVLKGKTIIKFKDTLAFGGYSLEELGSFISIPKLPMPEILKTDEDVSILLYRNYMVNDAKIVYYFVKSISNQLSVDNVKVVSLSSTPQIAISYVFHALLKKSCPNLITTGKRKYFIKLKHTKKIYQAYKGARVEAFKLGYVSNVTYIDCNSLYPYIISNMVIPDLTTEKLIYLDADYLLYLLRSTDMLGVVRVFLYNDSDMLPFVMIRSGEHNYAPTKGKYMITTITLDELRYALSIGYKLIDVDWLVSFKPLSYNPFTDIYRELYTKRKSATNDFLKFYYKSILNFSIGKMAQHKPYREYITKPIDECVFLPSNINVVSVQGLSYVYEHQYNVCPLLNYYCPLIPCLVNANARIYMHKFMSKIPISDLVYSDTDSICYTGDYDVFPINDNMGAFKLQHKDVPAIVYCPKALCIGDSIKLSSVPRRYVSNETFKAGKIKYSKMVGLSGHTNLIPGTFVDYVKDLDLLKSNYEFVKNKQNEQKIYIDKGITDINRFEQKVNSISCLDNVTI